VQLVADARKFGERGLNVIVTADAVDDGVSGRPAGGRPRCSPPPAPTCTSSDRAGVRLSVRG
jgi:hypothetical protein